jgi:transcriptional regulator with XRE-family HTH domain
MTPFGAKLRELRQAKGVTLAEMSRSLGISSAYLSALEHGKRGRPSWYLVQRIIAYFNVIWDDAEQLLTLSRISHPRIVIDTSGLSPKATELANRLSLQIATLTEAELDHFLRALNNVGSGRNPTAGKAVGQS